MTETNYFYQQLEEDCSTPTTHIKLLTDNNIFFLASVFNILHSKKCTNVRLHITTSDTIISFTARDDVSKSYSLKSTDFDRYLLHAYQFCSEILGV